MPGEQPRRRRLDVALDARHLPGEEQRRTRAHLPRLGEHRRPVHVGVAVHHAEADELGLLEPGNQPQHARLIAPLDLRLEADEAEVIAGEVVLAQLHDGVRLAPGARIDRPTGFIGPKRSVSAPRCAITSIGRQPSKKRSLSKSCTVADSARDQRVVEAPRTRRASAGSSGSRPAPSSTPHAGPTAARHARPRDRAWQRRLSAPKLRSHRDCAEHLRSDRSSRPGRSG